MSLYVLFKNLSISDLDDKSLIPTNELGTALECYQQDYESEMDQEHSFDVWKRNLDMVRAGQVDSLKRLVADMLSEFQLYEVE